MGNFYERGKLLMRPRVRVYINAEWVRTSLMKMNRDREWLAKQIDTTKQYLWQMLDGMRCPSPQMREKIQKVFKGVPWETLFVYKKPDRELAVKIR